MAPRSNAVFSTFRGATAARAAIFAPGQIDAKNHCLWVFGRLTAGVGPRAIQPNRIRFETERREATISPQRSGYRIRPARKAFVMACVRLSAWSL
jgi:hypothetical protein